MDKYPPDQKSGCGRPLRLPYLPLWIGDYLADTRHLTTLEHGAYLLLIFEYWQKGNLPTEDRVLARIVGLSEVEWRKVRPAISAFFSEDWGHERLDADRAKAAEKSVKASASAGARWHKKPNANANALPMECNGSAKGMQSESEPESGSLPSVGRRLAASAPKRQQRSAIDPMAQPDESDRQAAMQLGLSLSEFLTEWAHFRDHHVAKGSLMASWAAAWRTWLANYQKWTFTGRGKAFHEGRESNFTKAARSLLAELEEDHVVGAAETSENCLRRLFYDDGRRELGSHVDAFEVSSGTH